MLCVIGVNFFWRYSMIFLLLVLTLNTFSTLFIPFIHNLLFLRLILNMYLPWRKYHLMLITI